MNHNTYSFKTGNFDCIVINDGKCPLPPVQERINSPLKDLTDLETLSLFIDTGKNKILIDTGFGAGSKMSPEAGLLIRNMQEIGLYPEQIDTVILSHCHVDHIAGNIDSKGNPVFPNARYFISRKEWEFYTGESNFSVLPEIIKQIMIETVQNNLIPLKNRIVLLDDEKEIIPGISWFAAPGHSPGQLVLRINSGNSHILCTFDVFHHPLEIKEPETFIIPPMTGEALDTRKKILSLAAVPETLVFAGHFPFPGLGHILREGNSSRWKPI